MRAAEGLLVAQAGAPAGSAPQQSPRCRRRRRLLASPPTPPPPPTVAALAGAVGYLGALRLALCLSPRVEAYRAMSREEQLEWDSRVPSTLHALAITAAAAYLFLCSPVFSADHVRGERALCADTLMICAEL